MGEASPSSPYDVSLAAHSGSKPARQGRPPKQATPTSTNQATACVLPPCLSVIRAVILSLTHKHIHVTPSISVDIRWWTSSSIAVAVAASPPLKPVAPFGFLRLEKINALTANYDIKTKSVCTRKTKESNEAFDNIIREWLL